MAADAYSEGAVWQYKWKGLPEKVNKCLKPYWNRRNELSVEESYVMWGIGVIVHWRWQNQVLEDVHREHLGIVRMKSIAKSSMRLTSNWRK